jgi:hypothetical protein
MSFDTFEKKPHLAALLVARAIVAGCVQVLQAALWQ